MALGEFAFIARHLRPLAAGAPGALDLLDDAALLDPPAGAELVLTKDAMVAGVHFLADDPPAQIAQKLLRVNLSDLAAMGAAPLAYLLALARAKDTPEAWLAEFCGGLAADQAEFGIALLGGDTVSTPGPLTLSLTTLGHVPQGQALKRSSHGAPIEPGPCGPPPLSISKRTCGSRRKIALASATLLMPAKRDCSTGSAGAAASAP